MLNIPLHAKFEKNENIRIVRFEMKESVFIKEIIGPDIEKIEISGGQKKIKTLCVFLNTTHKTPELEKVLIANTNINNFYSQQDCGTDALKVDLIPENTNSVEVIFKFLIVYFIFSRLFHFRLKLKILPLTLINQTMDIYI